MAEMSQDLQRDQRFHSRLPQTLFYLPLVVVPLIMSEEGCWYSLSQSQLSMWQCINPGWSAWSAHLPLAPRHTNSMVCHSCHSVNSLKLTIELWMRSFIPLWKYSHRGDNYVEQFIIPRYLLFWLLLQQLFDEMEILCANNLLPLLFTKSYQVFTLIFNNWLCTITQ